ncbi:uncharacterized protein LOC120118292 [Hibiscus syriacus]|uniref:uncharacterized protein LOC120118292 n=1 Tax=Hibiscus syriacus TaxID=106335 RepID=UPI0019218425|nr:uncharacterized protein LOC120118292 [Hibiscus syriacus]
MQESFKKIHEEMHEQLMKSQSEMMETFVSMLQMRSMDQINAPAVGTFTEEPLYPLGFTPKAYHLKSKIIEPLYPPDHTSSHVKAQSGAFTQPGRVNINLPSVSINQQQVKNVPNFDQEENKESNKQLEQLMEEVRVIKECSNLYEIETKELSLVPDLVLPPKFKMPNFEKFDGMKCPSTHITMFCRKMAGYIGNDQLLIHFFQESLTGLVIQWCNQLSRTHIKSWKDLAKSFLEQYKHVNDIRPNRMVLQNMEKKLNERFRYIVMQVHPPMEEEETNVLFVNTLKVPFFTHLIGNSFKSFADIVTTGEMIEMAIKRCKLESGESSKKPFMKKKENEESEKQGPVDKGKKVELQFKEDENVINEPIIENEAVEFFKFLKHSEYNIVEQLHKLLVCISDLALLLSSEAHRNDLLKVLNQTFVPKELPVNKLVRLIANIQADNFLSFFEDEILSEMNGSSKAPHITVKCK